MKKKLKITSGTSKARIMEGYEEILGIGEYSNLPKRAKEDLYKRYKAIERATIEYNRENQSKIKKKKGDRDI
jgi:hypothetical protein